MIIIFIVSSVLAIYFGIQLSIVKKEKDQLLSEIAHKNIELSNTQQKKDSYYSQLTSLQKASGDLNKINADIEQRKADLEKLESDITIISYNFSDYDGITSEECKNKIALLKIDEQSLLKDEEAVICTVAPEKGTKRLYTNNIRQIMRCFNTECDNILLNITVKNIDTLRSKMQKSFETLNKIFDVDNVKLSPKLLDIKLQELNLAYTAELKKEAEKEEQKAIKAQMIEEEKVRREIEREKAKIDKEEHQFRNEISKLMKYLQNASDIEKQLYIDKINELEDKLKLLEKDKADVLQREQNTRAGYVYIISNIGSFGENIYKIGMTRRLEPMDRVKELGDASVPFEFDVHAMIFSEDAPKLENTLHETFKSNQVNKVNPRKEFYDVSLEDIEKVVKENYNATVEFTKIAKADQYRESLRIADKLKDK